MLTKPILLPVGTFDAIDRQDLGFFAKGGDQIFHNELEIYYTSNNTRVYTKKITTFNFEHTLDSSSLTNNKDYYARIRTYNKDNEFSPWSDNVYFKCLQKPVIAIPTVVTGKVNNQTILFKGACTSPQDPIKSYRYLLYDKTKVRIAITDAIFNNTLEYEFTGFLDDEDYYIELKVQTQNEVEVSTGLLQFKADFVAPRVKMAFELYNYKENASVKLDAKLIQMFWKSKYNKYKFENGTWIDLTNDLIYLDSSEEFGIKKNFTSHIILKNIKEDVPFKTFAGKYGELEFVYFNNRIHAYKKLNGIKDKRRYTHYMTNECFSILQTDTIYFYVQSINGGLNMRMEKIV